MCVVRLLGVYEYVADEQSTNESMIVWNFQHVRTFLYVRFDCFSFFVNLFFGPREGWKLILSLSRNSSSLNPTSVANRLLGSYSTLSSVCCCGRQPRPGYLTPSRCHHPGAVSRMMAPARCRVAFDYPGFDRLLLARG